MIYVRGKRKGRMQTRKANSEAFVVHTEAQCKSPPIVTFTVCLTSTGRSIHGQLIDRLAFSARCLLSYIKDLLKN